MHSTDFQIGFLIGVLVGEGHFGGDGRQPHITLRMHTHHEPLFRWLERTFPGGKLYGPYHHSGRSYYQWMARGAFLRDVLIPILDAHLTPDLDGPAYHRYQAMRKRYFPALPPAAPRSDADLPAQAPPPQQPTDSAPGDRTTPQAPRQNRNG